MSTKTELMQRVISGATHEAFTHTIYGTFDITLMRGAAPAVAESVMVPLYEINPFIRRMRVTEPARIAILDKVSWESDPGMGFDSPDGFVMVDGHHRALRREKEGCTHMLMWRFPEGLMSAFRPGFGWVNPADIDPNLDWGDPIVDGKIVRKGA